MEVNLPGRQDFFGGIDRARLKTFKPVQQAIDALSLPLLRQRKLNGILNALMMQIEDGSDSDEVNKLLIEALRAAVIFQIGETAARPVMEALALFEQAETRRRRDEHPGRRNK